MFLIVFIFFILFYIFINYFQSNVGLYPKLAQKYPSNMKFKKTSVLELLKLTEIYLVKEGKYSKSNKDMEYRPWLNIMSTKNGLSIQQTKSIILLFPKNFLIPWQDIKFIKMHPSIFKDEYIYRINLTGENIYIITKKNILVINEVAH